MVEANFSKYKLEKTLGTGFNSKVKLALNKENGKRYAIKVIKNTFPRLIELLKKEYHIVQQLDHDNVIKVYEFYENITYNGKNGQKGPCAAIVMDLMEGGDLFGYIAESKGFSEEVARKCFQIIIEVLGYCHTKANFAHRDLKPENLLLDREFNLKIADFGFAASMVDKNGSSLMLSTLLGTEGYKAPELYRNKPYEGSAVDVFAAGVILFAMHTNSIPFSKPADGSYQQIFNNPEAYWTRYQKHIREFRGLDFSFNEDFKKIITSMLAFNQEDRVGITEINHQPWYHGPTVSTEELKAQFALLNEKMREKSREERLRREREREREKEKEKERERDRERQARDELQSQKVPGVFTGFGPRNRSLKLDLKAAIDPELESKVDFDKERKLREYIRYTSLSVYNEVLTTLDVQSLFKVICLLSKEHFTQFNASDDEYKVKGKVVKDEESLIVNIILSKVDEDVTCVEFQKKTDDQIAFYEFVDQMKKQLDEIEDQC